MIPPRHRPYFETKHPLQRNAPTVANDVSLYSYVRNSVYHEVLTKSTMWGSGFVDKKFVYNDHVIRRRDDKDDAQTDNCKEFEVGNPDRSEFYSPNYPGNYTKNTECVRLLEGRKLFSCICLSAVNVYIFFKSATAKTHA
jgi:hypothetical protein